MLALFPSTIRVKLNKIKARVFSLACKALLSWALPTPETCYSLGKLSVPAVCPSRAPCVPHATLPLSSGFLIQFLFWECLCPILTPSCPSGLKADTTFSGNTSGPSQLRLAALPWSSCRSSGWPLSRSHDREHRTWSLLCHFPHV